MSSFLSTETSSASSGTFSLRPAGCRNLRRLRQRRDERRPLLPSPPHPSISPSPSRSLSLLVFVQGACGALFCSVALSCWRGEHQSPRGCRCCRCCCCSCFFSARTHSVPLHADPLADPPTARSAPSTPRWTVRLPAAPAAPAAPATHAPLDWTSVRPKGESELLSLLGARHVASLAGLVRLL